MIIALYGAFAVAALVIILPWVRRDKMAAFWFAAMLLAAIPESSLVPLSKNFGFVAVGALWIDRQFHCRPAHPSKVAGRIGYRIPAWIACVLLLLAHVPGAIAERVIAVKASSFLFAWASRGLG